MASGKRLTIYPFQKDFIAGAEYLNRINAYDKLFLVAQKGLGLTGKDAGHIDNREEIGIKLSDDLEDCIEKSDALLIAPCMADAKLESRIADSIDIAISRKKEILCALRLDEPWIANIRQKCKNHDVSFTYFYNNDRQTDQLAIVNEALQEFHTPVVFVAGTSDNVNKFDIQLALREDLQKQGYTLSQIGSQQYCECLGFHSFPEFMFSRSYSESEKILLFNAYVKYLEETEKPDLIIIGIPGGSMPYNKTITNNFGILLYLASQAVIPDYAIVGVSFEEYYPIYFDRLDNSFRYKYGYSIDCFHVSNAQLNSTEIQEKHKLCFNYIPNPVVCAYIQEHLSAIKHPVLNVLSADDRHGFSDRLIGKLAEYSYMVQMNG